MYNMYLYCIYYPIEINLKKKTETLAVRLLLLHNL